MKKNFQTKWFEVLEELGENHAMSFAVMNKSDRQFSWKQLPHTNLDGFGGIISLLIQMGYSYSDIDYQLVEKKSPSFTQKIKALIAYNPESKLRHTYWNNYDRLKQAQPFKAAYYFTHDEALRLKQLATQYRTSEEIYFLWKLDDYLAKNFLKPKQERWWMLPINMRSHEDKYSMENQSSYISVQIDDESLPRQIHKQIIKKIKTYTHWAAWFWMKVLSYLGKKSVKNALAYYDKNNHGWTGIYTFFSYLPLTDKVKDKLFFGVAPVTKAHPVACNFLSVENDLLFTLNFHAGLLKDQNECDEIILKIKSHILS